MRTESHHIITWWEALLHPESAGRLVLETDRHPGFNQFLVISVASLYALYGFSMGLFRGYLPAVVSALKFPFLYLFTLLICFPPFYVLNCLLGPRLRVNDCLRLLLIATSANAAAVASYAPISFLFTMTTSTSMAGYHFLVLMHVVVLAVSAIASIVVIGLIFRATAAALRRGLRPIFVWTWSVLYAFIGTQMAWVLRPWIGTWTGPYYPLRPLGGSFIESLFKLIS